MKRTRLIDLGVASYVPVWRQQEELHNEIIAAKLRGEETGNCMMFVEHNHVYTLGKSGNEANMLVSAIQLQAAHAEFVKVNRGGDITYHGPGHLVVYPIIDLPYFGGGLNQPVHLLEFLVPRTVGVLGITGERLEGATGVWLDAHTPQARKICAIGIKCSRYVTMHGFALNVNTDLNYFNYINPCGFVDKGVTSIAKEEGAEHTVAEVKTIVKKYFEEHFGMDFYI